MKKVITTVGTSIFTKKENDYEGSIEDSYKDIKDKRKKEWENNYKAIKYIKNIVRDKLNRDSSAEIKSISLLKQKLAEELDIYFICTDTVASCLAGEILKEYFEKDKGIKVFFDPIKDVIDNLQIEDSQKFLEGLENLINRFDNIASGYYENIILNITGGFKAIIPYMTVLGQVNGIPLYYVFEETDNLIEIPPVPIDINQKIFEKYENEFELLDDGEIKQKSDFSHDFLKYCASCLETTNNLITLNPLGKILWNKYLLKYYSLYCTDQVFTDIENYKDIKRIIQTKYHHIIDRQKVEKKKDHYVYDDGKNNNRIYFFKEDEKLFIYRVFINHDDAEKFIDTPFGDEEKKKVKDEAKIRRFLRIKED